MYETLDTPDSVAGVHLTCRHVAAPILAPNPTSSQRAAISLLGVAPRTLSPVSLSTQR